MPVMNDGSAAVHVRFSNAAPFDEHHVDNQQRREDDDLRFCQRADGDRDQVKVPAPGAGECWIIRNAASVAIAEALPTARRSGSSSPC